MTQIDPLPPRRQGWYPLKRSFFSGRNHVECKVVISLSRGMSFASIREEMEDIELEFGSDYENFKFETVTKNTINGDEINEITAFGFRTETDDEYRSRLNADQASAFEQEQAERAELARLMKKYPNNEKIPK
jgi:hypothetical protein